MRAFLLLWQGRAESRTHCSTLWRWANAGWTRIGTHAAMRLRVGRIGAGMGPPRGRRG